jgi:2-dehydro-3-deoxyphosphogluconate aldolase / (4S)-4-hydroxy-2-oxoglutarate aldolase
MTDMPDATVDTAALRLVAVIRAERPEDALFAARAMAAAGVRGIEITFTVPNAAASIREAIAALPPTVVVGAGTVLTEEQATDALQAGARFLVSPICDAPLVRIGHAAGALVAIGGLTPTEIVAAARAGADYVKVFPGESLGGPTYIKHLRGPLPDIPLMVTGGVTRANAAAYLAAGAQSVGLGSDLMPRSSATGATHDGRCAPGTRHHRRAPRDEDRRDARPGDGGRDDHHRAPPGGRRCGAPQFLARHAR